MVKKSQIIFTEGKELALKALFSDSNCKFGYLAVGYSEDNGFQDPKIDGDSTPNGFKELNGTNGYQRVQLQLHDSEPEVDESTGKVLVRFQATLDINNIKQSQKINQIAIVDNQESGRADTKFYSATSFEPFIKSIDSSITFVIGFRI